MQEEFFLKLLSELGFPVAITIISVYIAFITLKSILADILSLITRIKDNINTIDDRIKQVETDISILDILITSALGVKIDLTQFTNKVSKQNEKEDEH